MNKKQFVRTTDEETREQLLKAGFTEITENAARGFCFINDGTNFSGDEGKLAYTNVMTL